MAITSNWLKLHIATNNTSKMPKRHSKCRGVEISDIGWGSDFECEYDSMLDCEECKYGMGKKDPEAKCNQSV